MYEWYEAEVRGLETRLTGAPPEPGSVVFYGSSSVRLWDTLQTDIGPLTGPPERAIVNLGFGGSTLAACVHYFDRLPGWVARENGPLRSFVFYAGENDLGDGKSANAVFESFIWLHAMVQERLGDTPFAFISIKPSPARAGVMDRIRDVNERVRRRIPERAASHYIDVFSEMVDATGAPRREFWSEDGIHLSAAGYRLWTEILSRYQDTLFR